MIRAIVKASSHPLSGFTFDFYNFSNESFTLERRGVPDYDEKFVTERIHPARLPMLIDVKDLEIIEAFGNPMIDTLWHPQPAVVGSHT